jgi:hypothetical protein
MTKIEHEVTTKLRTMKGQLRIFGHFKECKKASSFDYTEDTGTGAMGCSQLPTDVAEDNLCISSDSWKNNDTSMPKKATVRRSLSANAGSSIDIVPTGHSHHQRQTRDNKSAKDKGNRFESDIYIDFPNKFDLPKNRNTCIESHSQVGVLRDSICDDTSSTVDDESPLLTCKFVNRATFDNLGVRRLESLDRLSNSGNLVDAQQTAKDFILDNLSIVEDDKLPIRISKMNEVPKKQRASKELRIVSFF